MTRALPILLLGLLASPAEAQYYEPEPYAQEEVDVRIDLGAQAECAFTALGDGTSRGGTVFGMGPAIGLHIGLDIAGFLALLYVGASVHADVTGQSGRGYAGAGPAALVGWRPTLAPDTRLSIEVGGGFDYAVTEANDASSPSGERRIEGFFPTIHHRVLVTDGSSGLPLTGGLHVMAAIPPQAPDLFFVSFLLSFGIRSS